MHAHHRRPSKTEAEKKLFCILNFSKVFPSFRASSEPKDLEEAQSLQTTARFARNTFHCQKILILRVIFVRGVQILSAGVSAVEMQDNLRSESDFPNSTLAELLW